MDPVLTFILQIAIVSALVYFYFWIRSLARRVDRGNLNARIEELERSVADTTQWLETASDQIRRDVDRRTTQLKALLDSAENRIGQLGPEKSGVPIESESPSGVGSLTAEPGNGDPGDLGKIEPADEVTSIVRESSESPADEVLGEPQDEAEPTGAVDEPQEDGRRNAEPQPAGVSGESDTRRIILELAEQGISIPDIAKRTRASRSEVELVVAFRKTA